MNFPRALIEKYSTQGPRYTSYPTAVDFTSTFTEHDWRELLRTRGAERNGTAAAELISLYIHIPYCKTLCYFCACNRVISRERSVVRPYLDSLIREISHYRNLLGDSTVEQLHWGGGTPNYLLPEETIEIHESLLRTFPRIMNGADLSIEIDPRTVNETQLACYRRLGYNRISFGVQDFDATVQAIINRVQSFELTAEVCKTARDLEFSSINVDLIYGLPGQTIPTFRETIRKVIELRPERIALYGYAHVTWKSKTQNTFTRSPLPSPHERISLFEEALRLLADSGYISIGLDHFALSHDVLAQALKQGTLRRNFMGYTTRRGDLLIGFGASAISSCRHALAQNSRDVTEYRMRIGNGTLAIDRGIVRSVDDQITGSVIEELLCAHCVDIVRFEEEWKVDFYSYYADVIPALRQFEVDQLIVLSSNQLQVTEIGCYFLRNIAMAFDRYLPQHRDSRVQMFSQAV